MRRNAAASRSRPEPIAPAAMNRALVAALVALAVFFGIYGLAVQTEVGQHADEAALIGLRSAPERAQSGASRLLRFISVGSLVAAVLALGALAWLWRRPWLIVLPAAIVGLSLLATEAFKLVIFQRPDLWPSTLNGNSYPSGHTTIATSLGLSAVLIAPTRWRGWVAFAAALFAGGVGILVVTADWHRPSDPLGSYALHRRRATGGAALRARRRLEQAPCGVPGRRGGDPDRGRHHRWRNAANAARAGLLVPL